MNAGSKSIYEHILRQLANGSLATGTKIPSETELAKQFKTNRMNAHYAVKELEKEGFVERKKRQGTIIRKKMSSASILDIRDGISNIVRVFVRPNTPGNFEHWNESTLDEMERELNAKGHTVQYNTPPRSRKDLEELVEQLESEGCRGLVFFCRESDLNLLLVNKSLLSRYRERVFIVNPGTYPTDRIPFNSLSFDTFGEGMLVGEYLREKNVDDIHFLKSSDSYWVEQRVEGVKCALSANTEKSLDIILHDGNSVAKTILPIIKKSKAKPMFIFTTDKLAAQTIDELSKKKLTAGRDYHTISFNNDPRFRHHNLATIAPPVEEIGGAVVNLLLKKQWMISTNAQVNIKLQSRLVIRGS